MSALLSVTDMNVYYGVIHAVKGVSFEAGEGEIVTLIGANGAGKSTILKTVSGMLRSKSGSIVFDGKEISNVESYKLLGMGIAHVPEGRCIFQRLTVEENLEMGGYIAKPDDVAAAIEYEYRRFPPLNERRRQIAGTLSGCVHQMLALGRAMMTKPKLIMMDEPSMGLAPILVQQIFDIIQELNASGTTILLVEQNAQIALKIADRGYVLETGRIVLDGKASELLANESVKKAYLGG